MKKAVLSVFMVALAAMLVPSISLKAQEPVVKFWTWFQMNEARLAKAEPARLLVDLQQNLLSVDSGLFVEMDAVNRQQITFTADGDERLFPVVQELVQKAPKLANWQFVAFRQRISSDKLATLEIKMGDVTIGIRQLLFYPVAEKDSLDIIVYVPGINESNYLDIGYHCLILLDHLLGEYDCVMKVRHYDFHAIPTRKNERDELLPLADLPAFVDRFHSQQR